MIRRLLVASSVALAVSLPAMSVSAHEAHPCNDSGEPGNSDYAKHHIVPTKLGNDGHKPGAHNGFSLCIPQAGWK